jgi:hypothetical protein
MTEAARDLLIAFESLPAEERRELAVEILRREAVGADYETTEGQLVQAADRVFLELERNESSG